MTGDIARGLGLVYFTNASNGTSLVRALAAPVFGTTTPRAIGRTTTGTTIRTCSP